MGLQGHTASPGKGNGHQAGTKKSIRISDSSLCSALLGGPNLPEGFCAGSLPLQPILQHPPVTADRLGGEDPGALVGPGGPHSLTSWSGGNFDLSGTPSSLGHHPQPARALWAPRKQPLPPASPFPLGLYTFYCLGTISQPTGTS